MSLSAWIFVVRPPRERPIACSCSPFSAARRAMRFDRGEVNGQSHAVLAAAGERFKDRPPMSALAQRLKRFVDRRVRTIVGRAIASACAALKHVNDTADDASIIVAHRTRLVRWQMRHYQSPCLSLSQNSPLRTEAPHGINPVRGNQSSLLRYRP